jgi:hypothetical protein
MEESKKKILKEFEESFVAKISLDTLNYDKSLDVIFIRDVPERIKSFLSQSLDSHLSSYRDWLLGEIKREKVTLITLKEIDQPESIEMALYDGMRIGQTDGNNKALNTISALIKRK